MDWRPIDTAPKDGTEIIVYVPDFHEVSAAWYSQQTGLWPYGPYAYSEDGEPVNVGLPSHWMPFPAPPGAA